MRAPRNQSVWVSRSIHRNDRNVRDLRGTCCAGYRGATRLQAHAHRAEVRLPDEAPERRAEELRRVQEERAERAWRVLLLRGQADSVNRTDDQQGTETVSIFEAGEKVAIQIRLPAPTAERIREIAKEEGLTLTAWCRRALLLRLKEIESKAARAAKP